MAHSSPYRAPTRTRADDHDDLAQSLRHLSLATSKSPQHATRSPSSMSSRSPSSMSVRGPTPKSPLSNIRPESRAATPGLLRKASMNSLRSVSVSGVAPPRRASSVNMTRSPLRSPRVSVSPPEERPPRTAASVACDYFKLELALRHGEKPDPTTETIVVLHDSCYGHRFSRPRTSRAALGTIVERPERMKASALGVAAAYVRLGERHSDGIHPIDPSVNPAAIPSIPFRIQKTTRRLPLMSQAVTNVHGTKWMEELKIMCDSAETKLAMNGKELQRPDMNRGSDQEGPPPKFHEGDLYLCAESLDALEGSLGGVCEAVDAVFSLTNPAKRAFVAIRPPGHHCSDTYPSGFCWVNNVHVGIMHGILSHGLTHAAIIDFDLHHGDGSQTIAWQHNTRGNTLAKNAAWWKKPSIGYFSLHDINSYPCEGGDEEKVKNASVCIESAHGQNVWNVHLQPWKTEVEFWELYETKYSVLLDKTRQFLRAQTEKFRAAGQTSAAKGAIFLSAGFDASEWEGAGMQRHNVNVPTEFYARLTRDVVKIAAEEGTSVEGRVVSVLEGGYSDRALFSGILSHISGLAGDDPVTSARGSPLNEVSSSPNGKRLSGASITHARRESLSLKNMIPLHPYESEWWHVAELERLEATMNAPLPGQESRQPRSGTPPTYSSPTQSSQAKVVPTTKSLRRSLSSSLGYSPSSPVGMSRAPSPPPPDVPWTTAAHELSKLLIPSHRQTDSCRPEDLSAEATRQRRDKQAMAIAAIEAAAVDTTVTTPTTEVGDPVGAMLPPPTTTRKSTRDRKMPKSYSELDKDDFGKANRRKTVAGTSVLASEKAVARGVPSATTIKPRQASRRLSAASTVVSDISEIAPLPSLTVPNGTALARPGTSQAIRPESSMSVRSTMGVNGGSLSVKKSRVTAAKKEPAPRAPTPKKTPSPAKPPIKSETSSQAAATRPVAPRAPASTSSVPPRRTGGAANAGNDIDSLTSGMKKIKINLITKAQKEALDAARGTDKPAPKKVATPTEERSPQTLVPGSAPERMQTTQGLSINIKQERKATTPLTSPSPTDSAAAPHTPDLFVPFQPEGPTPKSLPHGQQLPLRWLPPNMDTPSPMKRKDHLPVFTATSAIPFAGAGTVPPLKPPTPAADRQRSVYEIPETPQK